MNGSREEQRAIITILDYEGSKFYEKKALKAEECFPYKGKRSTTWIRVQGLEPVVVEKICNYFGIHHLVQEDIMHTRQRPKFEDHEDYLFIVMRMIGYNHLKKSITEQQISMILSRDVLITFEENSKDDLLQGVKRLIEEEKGRIRKTGTDYLAYSIIDTILDNYFIALELAGEKIEEVEQELVKNPTPKTLEGLRKLKKEMIMLRKSIWPAREVVLSIEKTDSKIITKQSKAYFRNLYDHIVLIIDNVETYREMLSGMLDVYLSSINNRLNEIMKFLTIITTVFIPLSFIASIYGMNFRYMPELDWVFGYPAVLLLMLFVGASLVYYFKRKGWI
ncbi:MAG: magnesium/cobalt transporter CorA [Candidatus Anstonellales archaeon]